MLALPMHLAPMGHINDQDGHPLILYRADDPIVAHAVPPEVLVAAKRLPEIPGVFAPVYSLLEE